MKQLAFELLRHGPPNNQLLSPLTPYLALCANHEATTIRMPFDHNQLLYRMEALQYKLGERARIFEVKEMSQALGEVLGQVPGLTAELNRDSGRNVENGAGSEDTVSHLRMILSASELALLPFEMSLSPAGFPGTGQPLLLQEQSPICLTRELRRARSREIRWPKHPKVLFISASPGDVGPIPMEGHLQALRSVLEPWADYAEPEGDRRLGGQLVVLREATCASIEQACAEQQFSYVHILAHGIAYQDGYDVRYGLALHNPMDPFGPADRVSGERLVKALMPVSRSEPTQIVRPVAVTLASCDSAGQGGVLGPGGSVAYALHQADIPMVFGSLFPMSVAASQYFVRVLYEALLWGKDPRVALYELRRRLFTLYPETHDWASVTAYTSLPESFERSLANAHIGQTVGSMDAAMKFGDRVTEQVSKPKSQSYTSTPFVEIPYGEKVKLLEEATNKMDAGRERLESLFKNRAGDRPQLAGKLAATEKRCAQAYFYFSRVDTINTQRYTEKWQRLLQKSRQHYWNVFELNRDEGWAVVQFLSLDLILRRLTEPIPDLVMEQHEEHNKPEALWNLAHVLSINDLRARDPLRRQWAMGNLVELYLIALLMDPHPIALAPGEFELHARKHAHDLVDLAGAESFDVYATRRQILRYDDWYWEIANIAEIEKVAPAIIHVLPAAKPSGQS